jgi:hypothetical protein
MTVAVVARDEGTDGTFPLAALVLEDTQTPLRTVHGAAMHVLLSSLIAYCVTGDVACQQQSSRF